MYNPVLIILLVYMYIILSLLPSLSLPASPFFSLSLSLPLSLPPLHITIPPTLPPSSSSLTHSLSLPPSPTLLPSLPPSFPPPLSLFLSPYTDWTTLLKRPKQPQPLLRILGPHRRCPSGGNSSANPPETNQPVQIHISLQRPVTSSLVFILHAHVDWPLKLGANCSPLLQLPEG